MLNLDIGEKYSFTEREQAKALFLILVNTVPYRGDEHLDPLQATCDYLENQYLTEEEVEACPFNAGVTDEGNMINRKGMKWIKTNYT